MEDTTYILYNRTLNLKNQIVFYDKGEFPNEISINIKKFVNINSLKMVLINNILKINPYNTNNFCYLEGDINTNNLFPNNKKIYINNDLSFLFGSKTNLINLTTKTNLSDFLLKNNSLFINYTDKLENLPFFLWINLDRSIKRKADMETLFKKHNLRNIRISGFDGFKNKDFYVESLKYGGHVYGCTCSHLKALEYFVNELKDDYCIICEDDLSFEYCNYWKKDFNDYLKEVPKDWELILLNVNTTYPMTLTPTKFVLDRYNSTGCYIVKREAAIKILNAPFFDKKDNKYIFNFKRRIDITADKCLYRYLKHVYVFPLFTYKNENSIMHNSHLRQHQKSKNKIYNLWKKSF